MGDSADRFWDKVVPHLQRKSDTAPGEGAESDAVFHAAPEVPLSPTEIDSTVRSVLSGELATWDVIDDGVESDSATHRHGVFQGRKDDGPDEAEREDLLNELRRLASEQEQDPEEDEGGDEGITE